MSVHDLRQDVPIVDWLGEAKCFFCGEHLDGVAVLWKGSARTDADRALIALHPSCAKDLAIELAGDARNAIRVIEKKDIALGCMPILAERRRGAA